MRAVVTTGDERVFEFVEVAAPVAERNQVVVAVEATSMNRGEIGALVAEKGLRPGWDVAGKIVEEALDGSGPAIGTRVVGVVDAAAWAEQVAVPTSQLAVLSEEISTEMAAALPVVGLTAWFALKRGGPLLGRDVLVTGALGGVSRMAIQLARIGGSTVTATVRDESRVTEARRLGAANVVTGLLEGASFDLVIDSIGGPVLSDAIAHSRPDGVIVTYGRSSREPINLDPAQLYRGGVTLSGLNVFHEIHREGSVTRALETLVNLLASGNLDAGVSIVEPWTRAVQARSRVLNREIRGKAVLTISGT